MTASVAPRALDPARVREDFPALAQEVHGRPLVYLDNASTAQKPRVVAEAMRRMLEEECANIHRGVHTLSTRATDRYEGARETVRRFVNAGDSREIVFTRGATESINLVAQTFGRAVVGPGDRVLISTLEHHSNLVPWQMLCAERGAELVAIPLDARGQLDLGRIDELLSPRTRIVALSQVSNAIGTITPLQEIIPLARGEGAAVLIDGAQAAPHLRVDVRALDCDFYCFSGHKLYGPTGTGVLYGKRERLSAMPPWQGGGDMILSVTLGESLYAEPPQRFEAGTPNIAGIVGMAAAIEYLESLGLESIAEYERRLLDHGTSVLSRDPRPTDDRHGREQDSHPVLRAPRHPPSRRGHGPRLRGHRRPHRPALRPAVDGPLRGPRHDPGVALVLQHPGRARRPRPGLDQGRGDVPMNPSLRDLYQRLILEHNAHPRNFGPLRAHTHEGMAHNPLCGDTVTLRLRLDEGTIAEARFEGNGCAVSRASASLLTLALACTTPEEASAISAELHKLLSRGPEHAEANTVLLGELVSLEGVREVPARLRCATLPWEALRTALGE